MSWRFSWSQIVVLNEYYQGDNIFSRTNIIQRLLIELVIYLLIYKVEWGDFHPWYHQESCMFGRQAKEHIAVVNSSFGDVFDKNYFVVSIVFVASKKIWISKIDERDISTSFENVYTSMWVNCRSVDVFLSFIII